MKNKETFGEYILMKRKEAGLTQKNMAEKLFVTESAVSKWERGLSYPDITLIRDICTVLDISEHELLTASEDTETRNYEKQAKKYNKLTKTTRHILGIIYGIGLIVCFIVNIAVEHRLSWFFIVLGGVLVAFTVTLLPVLLENNKGLITLGSLLVSMLLLLFICNIFVSGNWFVITAISVIFGFSLVFLPFVLKRIILTEPLVNHTGLIYFIVNSVLLFVLLLTANLFSGGGWFLTTAVPIAAFSLLLPWGYLLIIRYTKLNGLFKAAACFGLNSLFFVFCNRFINYILDVTETSFSFKFDFSNWSTNQMINNNINSIILIVFLFFTVLFAVAGIISTIKEKK